MQRREGKKAFPRFLRACQKRARASCGPLSGARLFPAARLQQARRKAATAATAATARGARRRPLRAADHISSRKSAASSSAEVVGIATSGRSSWASVESITPSSSRSARVGSSLPSKSIDT